MASALGNEFRDVELVDVQRATALARALALGPNRLTLTLPRTLALPRALPLARAGALLARARPPAPHLARRLLERAPLAPVLIAGGHDRHPHGVVELLVDHGAED